MLKPRQSLRQLSSDKVDGVRRVNAYSIELSMIVVREGHNVRDLLEPDYWETDKARTKIEAIKQIILAGGYLPPISVQVIDSVVYLHDGEHRLRAYREIHEAYGEESWPVPVTEFVGNDVQADYAHVNANKSDAWTPIQIAELLHRPIEKGATIQEVATNTGYSVSTVSKYLKLRQLPLSMKKDVDSGKLSIQAALDSFENKGTKAALSKEKMVSNAAINKRVLNVMRNINFDLMDKESDGMYTMMFTEEQAKALQEFYKHYRSNE